MSRLTWIIFGGIIVLVLGGLIVYSRLTSPAVDVSAVDANAIQAAAESNGNIADHVFGKADSTVRLVEYGDFQCPSCASAHPNLKGVLEEYKDRIAFVFRNYPLTTIHPNARAAAAAVEAAGLQGKYWEYHDVVFENRSEWQDLTGNARTDMFASYADELALDKERFLADLAGTSVNQKISFDQALGKKAGVDATPTFYLNGEKVSSEASSSLVQGNTSALTDLLDKALAR